ncbi:JAB domain-containing protein [Petralouisia muris]|jgi:DNA repair protein RadC|uniref:JAB domain-containing protein n=1 Tax=Petralouisia muris TaxID=3032872 RepID=A0AC61RXI5_9FIRM|nr:DNA repair protein RadC [Petralouisia muris]TGY96715.1 JAB domain-containing protein [Petralouisia muris]
MNTHITMKEMPESEQPLEKCFRYGAQALSDAELLAVILKTGTRNLTALQLAQLFLSRKEKNLLNLSSMLPEEMQMIPGIGQVKAAQLKCIAELAERIARTSRLKNVRLNEPSSIADYYMESLRHKTKEHLLLAMFDAKSNLLGDKIVSVGTVTNSLVSPREIFLKALEYRAVHIVLLHNHPSGDPTPSEADHAVTSRVAESGRILGIALADHIIIGDNRYISFRENGLLG